MLYKHYNKYREYSLEIQTAQQDGDSNGQIFFCDPYPHSVAVTSNILARWKILLLILNTQRCGPDVSASRRKSQPSKKHVIQVIFCQKFFVLMLVLVSLLVTTLHSEHLLRMKFMPFTSCHSKCYIPSKGEKTGLRGSNISDITHQVQGYSSFQQEFKCSSNKQQKKKAVRSRIGTIAPDVKPVCSPAGFSKVLPRNPKL